MHNPHANSPAWAALPALSRVSVSSVALWNPFRDWNASRPWAEQIKPFNFLLVADIDPFGYPPGVDPTRFRLIAPYTNNPEWALLEWRNLYDPDGRTYRITTDRNAPAEPDLVIAKSYQHVLREYRLHPEHKFHGPDCQQCQRLTRGVLQRRPIHLLGTPRLIGKEANELGSSTSGRWRCSSRYGRSRASASSWRRRWSPSANSRACRHTRGCGWRTVTGARCRRPEEGMAMTLPIRTRQARRAERLVRVSGAAAVLLSPRRRERLRGVV